MDHPRTRAELIAEMAELRKQQLDAATDAVFGCLTREQEASRQDRCDRLALLVMELEALDGTSQHIA
jgi:hypothetical protein